MRHESRADFSSKNPASLIIGVVIALGVVASIIFGKPAFLDGILKTTPYDANISQKTLHQRTADTLKREIQTLYRTKHIIPLIDTVSNKPKASPADIAAINRSIDSFSLTSLSVSRRFPRADSHEVELIVTANYSMTPPLDNVTSRSFRYLARNYGDGTWTFLGEFAQ